ncbi:NAD-binding protein [Phellopilus nigrolimitatus]|nr:NAD-binding protein [Phellopilus nigrolimitatus]
MVFMDGRGPSPLRPPVTPYKQEALSPIDAELHPSIHAGRVAVITGAASGIGRAAAVELAKQGLRVALADVNEAPLKDAGAEVTQIVGEQNVLVVPTDVSRLEDVVRLKDTVLEQWGEVAVLMNNAGIGLKGTSWDGLANWKKVFDVNVFGIVNVQQVFVPVMIHQENPSVIINTGSKQGITNPPGNAAYNASKAAVKALTEQLAHELRSTPGTKCTAHLFVPGWTHTGMTGGGRAVEKPAGAWSAQETVLYMLDRVRGGAFYVLCPDGETRPAVDALRVLWAAGDVAEGRPALSRWHGEYKPLFDEYMREGLASL